MPGLKAGRGSTEMTLDCRLWRKAALLARVASRAMRLRSEEGGSLVEFAIVVPLLMTVLTGSASFALAFYSLQQLGNATSGAVEAIAATQGVAPDPCALAVTSVTSALGIGATSALPNWTASKITYKLVITDSSGATHTYGATTGSSFSCIAGAAEEAPNEPVTLTVSYSYTWLPVLAFSPSSPLSSAETAMAD
jgi:Flp pilus assembly protein TadG